MSRKSAVTQDAVNKACDQLQAENKNVTVNAVIGITGGSFSTVGAMVKEWKDNAAAASVPVIEMPETVTAAMHKAVADIWGAASALAGEAVERVQSEAKEAIGKAKAELSEYAGEVSRLESEAETAAAKLADSEKRLADMSAQVSQLTTQNAALSARLDDRGAELERVRGDYEKLQAELLAIAKAKDTKPAKTKGGEG